MRSLLFAVSTALVALISRTSAQNSTSCGPSNCYPEQCRPKATPVDLVLMVDSSGSMADEIAGVTRALNTLVQQFITKQIDATFTVVQFAKNGFGCSVIAGPTTATGQVSSALNQMRLDGSVEAGLETIRSLTKGSTIPGVKINPGDKNSLADLKFRPEAQKVLFLLTDEDSDPAIKSDYRVPNQANIYDSNLSGYSAAALEAIRVEANDAATMLLNQKWFVYMAVSAVNPTTMYTTLTPFQYGLVSADNAGIVGGKFNATVALRHLDGLSDQKTRWSLQYKLLQGGSVARVFNVADLSGDTLSAAIFGQIAEDTSTCNACFDYKCSSSLLTQCSPPTYACSCSGQKDNATIDCRGVCTTKPYITDCRGCVPNDGKVWRIDVDCKSKCRSPDVQGDKNVTECCDQTDQCGRCSSDAGYAQLNRTEPCILLCDGKTWRINTTSSVNLNANPNLYVNDTAVSFPCGTDYPRCYNTRNPCGGCKADIGNPITGVDGTCPCSDENSYKNPINCNGVNYCLLENVDKCPPPTSCKDKPVVADPLCNEVLFDSKCNELPRTLIPNACGICVSVNRTDADKDLGKDSCGVCFGSKNSTADCSTSTAFFGCQGQAFTSKEDADRSQINCAFCGNGVKEAGEECDDGITKNGAVGAVCDTKCKIIVGGNNDAALIGGIVGGVAAAAALAAGGFFLYRYAVKSGLLGSAKESVDFGASTQNPLFKQQAVVSSNPLYVAS